MDLITTLETLPQGMLVSDGAQDWDVASLVEALRSCAAEGDEDEGDYIVAATSDGRTTVVRMDERGYQVHPPIYVELEPRANILSAEVEALVGSDGTDNIRVIVEWALREDYDVSAADIARTVREARAEWDAECEREAAEGRHVAVWQDRSEAARPWIVSIEDEASTTVSVHDTRSDAVHAAERVAASRGLTVQVV